MNPIFTIGHSAHSLDDLLALLRKHEVAVIADVRSQPYSRRFPQFCQQPLRDALRAEAMSYVFLGRECGARSEDPSCYDKGRIVYDRLAKTPAFQQGLVRLLDGAKRYRLALLCAEKDPLDCHRAVLVSRQLQVSGQTVNHILADGALESQADMVRRMRERVGLKTGDLFQTETELDELAYTAWGERMAYRPETALEDQP